MTAVDAHKQVPTLAAMQVAAAIYGPILAQMTYTRKLDSKAAEELVNEMFPAVVRLAEKL